MIRWNNKWSDASRRHIHTSNLWEQCLRLTVGVNNYSKDCCECVCVSVCVLVDGLVLISVFLAAVSASVTLPAMWNSQLHLGRLKKARQPKLERCSQSPLTRPVARALPPLTRHSTHTSSGRTKCVSQESLSLTAAAGLKERRICEWAGQTQCNQREQIIWQVRLTSHSRFTC